MHSRYARIHPVPEVIEYYYSRVCPTLLQHIGYAPPSTTPCSRYINAKDIVIISGRIVSIDPRGIPVNHYEQKHSPMPP